MKKILIALITALILVLPGCGTFGIGEPKIEEIPDGDVNIVITRVGMQTGQGVVTISNMHAGGTAEVMVNVRNATAAPLIPAVYINDYADIRDYSGSDGAVPAPAYMYDWLTLPEPEEIVAGETGRFMVSLSMPDDADPPARRVGFQLGVSQGNNASMQVALGVWVIVEFR